MTGGQAGSPVGKLRELELAFPFPEDNGGPQKVGALGGMGCVTEVARPTPSGFQDVDVV